MESLTLLTALINVYTSRAEEAQILDLLRTVGADELNALLAGVDAAALVASLDDHPRGPQNRASLLRLLTGDRAPELSVLAKANLAHALQVGRTSRHDELAIRDLFLSCRGEELTRLKNQINMRLDAHDLEALVYADVDDTEIRGEILRHIAAEGSVVAVRKAKVLSDIDDTVVARLHDDRYPKGTLYPGLLAVYDALDKGPTNEPFSTGDLTFVTARPMDALGLIENGTRASLRKAGIAQSSVLSGSFFNLHTHDAMAAKKVENITHYRLLFPEYRLIFLGDSGQGDVAVGEKMYEDFPDAVDLVLIHDVKNTPAERRAEYAAKGIHFHDTYVGAARVLADRALIAPDALERIVAETRAGLDALRWTSPEQEQRMRALVERDAAAG